MSLFNNKNHNVLYIYTYTDKSIILSFRALDQSYFTLTETGISLACQMLWHWDQQKYANS